MNSFELLAGTNGAINGLGNGFSDSDQLSKSARKRRNKKAKAASEAKGKSPATSKNADKPPLANPSKTPVSTQEKLVLGSEKKAGKKYQESFTPVQRRQQRKNQGHQKERADEAPRIQRAPEQITTSSSTKSHKIHRGANLLTQSLLAASSKDEVKEIKRKIALLVAESQGSEEYGAKATEILLTATSEIQKFKGNTALEGKLKQFMGDLVNILTASGDDQVGGNSEQQRTTVKAKFEHLSKTKPAESGPKLLERARVTSEWSRMIGRQLDTLLGVAKENPFGRINTIVQNFKSACLEEQGAVLSNDSAGYELPPEVVKIDASISALEQQLMELKIKRKSALDKHHSKQSAEQKSVLATFDRAIQTASKVDSEFAGLKNVLQPGSKKTKATKEETDLLAQYLNATISLSVCKLIQQKEINAKFEFYVQQITDFAEDGNAENESFVKKLTTMATNSLRDSAEICRMVSDVVSKLEQYTSNLQVKSLDVAPSLVADFYDNLNKIKHFHSQTTMKAVEMSSINFTSALAVKVQDLDEVANRVKGCLKKIKLTGKEVAVVEKEATNRQEQKIEKKENKENKEEAAKKGEGKGGDKTAKAKKLAPVPKENAWGKPTSLFK